MAILNKEIAYKAIQKFFRDRPFVFFGTGTSCAMDIRFGMGALREELIKTITPESLSPVQKRQWESVLSNLSKSGDLETAMNKISDKVLLDRVINITGGFVASVDSEYSYKILSGDSKWPAINLIKKLLGSLTPDCPYLPILTPNYDMLFEYACCKEQIPYTNGYVGGIVKAQHWKTAIQRFVVEKKRLVKSKYKTIKTLSNHIRLFKVHGSLNLFDLGNRVIENDSWMWKPPSSVRRMIITPGLSKYEVAHRYRTELLSQADEEIQKASSFLFLGYGFNDNHLDNSIKNKIVNENCNCLIITKDINANILDLANSASSVWVVSKGAELNGTTIYNQNYRPLQIKSMDLWDFVVFASTILGDKS